MINDTLIICEGDKFIRVRFTDTEPSRVSSPWEARHWRLIADAQRYRDRFPKENQNWVIKVFRATALWEVGKETRTDKGHSPVDEAEVRR